VRSGLHDYLVFFTAKASYEFLIYFMVAGQLYLLVGVPRALCLALKS